MKYRLWMVSLVAAIAAASGFAFLHAQTPSACCSPNAANWPDVGGNYGNQSYTSLTQIDKTNLATLGPAWVTHASAEKVTSPVPGGDSEHVGQQTTPIAIDGVLYFDTPSGGVMAIDGATGAPKWKWEPSEESSGFNPATTRRGVSVGDGKVYTLASGNRVVALDKNTGAQVWVVQPTAADGETLGNTSKVSTMYHDGLVYIGTNDSPRSATYALNAKDGSMKWYFYAAYPHGTVFTDVNGKTFDAGDTWTTKNTPNDTPNDCYKTAGAAPWIHGAIDPELGMIYWTFGNPRSCVNSQDGSGRPGDNLFSDSLVALDLKTGAYKWHFQSIRHDIWDMDNVHAPLLADVMVDGRRRKAIYYGSKQGHTFVLDRTNGKPVLKVEDRPVPVDSRQNSPATQPVPRAAAVRAAVRRVPEPRLRDPGQGKPRGAQLQRLPGRARPRAPRATATGAAQGQLPGGRRTVHERAAAQGLHERRPLGAAGAVDPEPERRRQLVEHGVQPQAQHVLRRVLDGSGGARQQPVPGRQWPARDRPVPEWRTRRDRRGHQPRQVEHGVRPGW